MRFKLPPTVLVTLFIILLTLILVLFSSTTSAVKIKGGKLSPVNLTHLNITNRHNASAIITSNTKNNNGNPNKLVINPSQQIVHLLTPQRTLKKAKNHGNQGQDHTPRKKKSSSAHILRKGVDFNFDSSASASGPPAWDLKYPVVPQLVGLSSSNSNANQDDGLQVQIVPTLATTSTTMAKMDNLAWDNSNLADSSWVGLSDNGKSSFLSPSRPFSYSQSQNPQQNLNLPDHEVTSRLPAPVSISTPQSVNRIGLYDSDSDRDEDEEDDSKSEEDAKKKKKTKKKGKNSKNKAKLRTGIDNEEPGSIDLKIQKLEELVSSLSKNVEVMRQNTGVISKGFNILSTRFNKLSSDHDELNLKLDNKFVLLEESVLRMQKDVVKKLKELDAKGEGEVKNLKKTNQDLLDAQVHKGEEHKKWMDNMASKLVTWKREGEKESKVIAEMVKALAEIQKKEKFKLDAISKRMEERFDNLNDDDHNSQKFADKLEIEKKIAAVSTGLEVIKRGQKNESEFLSRELGLLSKYVEEQVKRLEETILEQNMAHNMAHDNIASKLQKEKENPQKTGLRHSSRDALLDFSDLEDKFANVSLALEKLGEKVESMEDTDLSILSRIADLRNSQTQEHTRISSELNKTSEMCQKSCKKSFPASISKFSNEVHEQRKVPDDSSEKFLEVGGMSMNMNYHQMQPSSSPQSLLRSEEFLNRVSHRLTTNNDDKDFEDPDDDNVSASASFGTMEENVAELWRGHKECKAENQNVQTLVKQIQEATEKRLESLGKEIMEVEIDVESLKNLKNAKIPEELGNLDLPNLESRLESFVNIKLSQINSTITQRTNVPLDLSSGEIEEISGRVKAKVTTAFPQELLSLRDTVNTLKLSMDSVLTTNKNITKAQEFFLLKLLELDQDHKKDSAFFTEELTTMKTGREAINSEILRGEERLNKVVQQFEITDSEQAKIREELLNIKDRLNGLEENYVNLWKTNKKFVGELEQVVNNVDNINVVHGSELQTLATDLGLSREKLENVSITWRNVDNRLSNIELLMDVDVSEPNTSELLKLKEQLKRTEKDISELWKSSEILSFQQQVMGDSFKLLESTYENSTLSTISTLTNGSSTLSAQVADLSRRLSWMERATPESGVPYEVKTLSLEIPSFHSHLAGRALASVPIEYEVGGLLGSGLRSHWRSFLQVETSLQNGSRSEGLTLYNVLIRNDDPETALFNEMEVQILDGDGRVFTTYGPEQHLYRGKQSKVGISNIISLRTLETPKHNLLAGDTLRLRLNVKVYPKYEREGPPQDALNNGQESEASEKQLILWEIRDSLSLQLSSLHLSEEDNFRPLNISKEFAAGSSWGGFSLWRASLLAKRINGANYLGLSVELLPTNNGDNGDNVGFIQREWAELSASYNVTLLDAYSRISKEFSISPNDFISVSARHSYFMLVKDMASLLRRGDFITLKIYFDLHAKRRKYDVEVFAAAKNSLL